MAWPPSVSSIASCKVYETSRDVSSPTACAAWRRSARYLARCASSDKQVLEQSCREFASSHATTRATDAEVQIVRSGPAISVDACHDLRPLQATSPSYDRSRLSTCSVKGIPDLATGDPRPPVSIIPVICSKLPSHVSASINLAMPISPSIALRWQQGDRGIKMDVAYISALSALAGSVIGGMTSGITTWLNQRSQLRSNQIAHDISRREELYKEFILAASNAYGEAVMTNEPHIPDIIALYAMVSRMRAFSLPRTVTCAEQVMLTTIETYALPNKSIPELSELMKDGTGVDPLKDFAESVRAELLGRHMRG